MKKKSQVSTQFNWIYVLIAGSLIIIFFTNIVMKQKEISEKNLAAKVIGDLETIATGATIAKGTAQVLKKPDIDLVFSCEFCKCQYSMGGSHKDYAEKVIFSPSRIIGREMIAWTLDWSAPYRVTNFLFLTSPQVNYIIIDKVNNNAGSFINQTLPTAVHKEFYINSYSIAVNTLEDHNYPVVKIIYIVSSESNCGDLTISQSALKFKDWNLEREDLTAVCMYSITPDFNKGKVQFFNVDKTWTFVEDGQKMDVLGDESLFAALFAHDSDIFRCNIQNSFKRLELISRIYQNRSDSLSCTASWLYGNCTAWLKKLQNNATSISQNASLSYDQFYNIQSNLSYYNTQLQVRSCPEIY